MKRSKDPGAWGRPRQGPAPAGARPRPAGPENVAGAKAPPRAGPENSAGAKAPPGAGQPGPQAPANFGEMCVLKIALNTRFIRKNQKFNITLIPPRLFFKEKS